MKMIVRITTVTATTTMIMIAIAFKGSARLTLKLNTTLPESVKIWI